jgi:hypothetical protein
MRKLPLASLACAGLLIVAVTQGTFSEYQDRPEQSKPFATPATLVTIHFDPDQGISAGVQSSTFLASFGIPMVTFGGAPGAGPPAIFEFSHDPNSIVPSPPNVLVQSASTLDPYQTHRLTFTFLPMLTAFSLTRVGKANTGSTDTWRAHFFNAENVEIGSFGETTPMTNASPKIFTFNAPAGEVIASMNLDSVWKAFATHRNIPVDDFKLIQILR